MNLEKLELKRKVSLRAYTAIKIGGIADRFFKIHSVEDIITLIGRFGFSFYLLGAGSNLLIKDSLIKRPVIKLADEFSYLREVGNFLEVGASTPLVFLLKYCSRNNLGGLEYLIGIPATLGGLLAMNASSFGVSISTHLKEVDIVDSKASYKTLKKEEIELGDRFSSLKDYVILRARFDFIKDGFRKDKASEFINTRISRQDFSFPSCGCIFKNTPKFSAGFLIDSCGLKGLKRGDAQISNKHANFIVNLGSARYKDVDYLIQKAKCAVYDKYKINLEEEIKRWS